MKFHWKFSGKLFSRQESCPIDSWIGIILAICYNSKASIFMNPAVRHWPFALSCNCPNATARKLSSGMLFFFVCFTPQLFYRSEISEEIFQFSCRIIVFLRTTHIQFEWHFGDERERSGSLRSRLRCHKNDSENEAKLSAKNFERKKNGDAQIIGKSVAIHLMDAMRRAFLRSFSFYNEFREIMMVWFLLLRLTDWMKHESKGRRIDRKI